MRDPFGGKLDRPVDELWPRERRILRGVGTQTRERIDLAQGLEPRRSASPGAPDPSVQSDRAKSVPQTDRFSDEMNDAVMPKRCVARDRLESRKLFRGRTSLGSTKDAGERDEARRTK